MITLAQLSLAFALIATAVTGYLLGFARGYRRGVEEWGGKDHDA